MSNDIANRMYPAVAPAAATPAAKPADLPAVPAIAGSQDLAQRMYSDDGPPPTSGDYQALIAAPFEALERQLRETGDVANIDLVRQGMAQVNAAMRELGVGAAGAKELARTFAHYRQSPVDEDALESKNAECERQLRLKWGKAYAANLEYAKAAYAEARKRIPWLQDEQQHGAGSDPAVVIHFAAIGRKLARAGKK